MRLKLKNMLRIKIFIFLKYSTVVIIICFFLLPIVWLILASFKTRTEALAYPPTLLTHATLTNYMDLFRKYHFSKYLINSILVGTSSTLFSILFGSLAAYGLARIENKISKNLAVWLLSNRMFPPIVIVIPYFVILRGLGLIDTISGLVAVHTVMNLPFVVWLLRSFFRDVPTDIEESASMDGCSRIGVFVRIVLPLSKPGLITASIFCLMFSWNEFLFALMLTARKAKTLPLAMTAFIAVGGISWGPMGAGSAILLIPLLIAVVFLGRYLIRGLSFGALKE